MTRTEHAPRSDPINLPMLVVSRICVCAIYMTYPACLGALMIAWNMSATQAGLVQGAFSAAFAVSLLSTSFASDRYGAKRVFQLACLATFVSACIFALFARSFETALITLALLGLAQGGTYTPAIMMVSTHSPPKTKASAVGWMVAGMSAGYVVSISLATTMLNLWGYQAAFLSTASLTLLGWVAGLMAVHRAPHGVPPVRPTVPSEARDHRRRARLLVLGYIGHSWELFGMWAWIPAFLAAVVLNGSTMSGIELGLWTALTLHVSGFFSSFMAGYATDRLGARRVLIFYALMGLICSLSIGWMTEASTVALLIVAALYGFATIGDSSVLSSAITDAVPPARLGRTLGIRSILGIGTGAVSPVVFGAALDSFAMPLGWGIAFSSLALGGALALICAIALPR